MTYVELKLYAATLATEVYDQIGIKLYIREIER